jgi:D-alanyl-D-alanine carboxypeptidase/D-alanyl-D-alanine-endopeptidase (penicillin-binding protein 4)
MKRVTMVTLVLLVATTMAVSPARSAGARRSVKPAQVKRQARAWGTPALLNTKSVSPIRPLAKPVASDDETPPPLQSDPDRERIQRLQEALYNIVHGPVLGRLRVGVRVMDMTSGRVLFGRRGSALMDPASNQKVLATATALLRLGNDWQFRTELGGLAPDADGVVNGDLILRGSGDPSLKSAHLDELAGALATRGITRVNGSVLADPRRIGSSEAGDARSPLRVNRSAIEVRVRPADRDGAPPLVSVRPDSEAFVIENHATTAGKGRRRVTVALATVGGKMRVMISGRMPQRAPVLVVRRKPPNQPLYIAALLRASLVQAGIVVKGGAGLYVPRAPEPRRTASIIPHLDVPVPLEPPPRLTVLAVHDSDPLPVLMRRINKDSDNEWAERILETVGAEVYGGAATLAKGVRALREAITELGLPPAAYVPTNGSGLGHGNRITPEAMAELLRRLFLDPRLGPDMLQSLSVGGVDGTTRNRFRGSPAAERVRAKTGTLAGKSCLSGYVGDGSDILVFSIMVQGLRGRALANVRHAQVTAVNAMMRYARGAVGPAPGDELTPATDVEIGDEPGESETEETDAAAPGGMSTGPSSKESLDALVKKATKQLEPNRVAASARRKAAPAQ